jgi:hypothetical protein
MISTRDPSLLPDVDGLRLTLQSMAMLDAILSPEWQFRYYSFNAAWDADQDKGVGNLKQRFRTPLSD